MLDVVVVESTIVSFVYEGPTLVQSAVSIIPRTCVHLGIHCGMR